ncbi:MAG: cellulase family glycosylhydrolase [Chloroflexota bacterium]
MNKTYVKLAIGGVLVLLMAFVALATLRSLADLTAYFRQGADPAQALNIIPNVPPDLFVDIEWIDPETEQGAAEGSAQQSNNGRDTGRVLNRYNRERIESAYLRAWLQWNISYARQAPYGLGSYFTGPALDAVTDAIETATKRGQRINQVDTKHSLKLHLYSADGTIVSFTDERAQVVRRIEDETGKVIYVGETTERYEVVMVLHQGRWRVRHWLRTELTDDAIPPSPPHPLTPSPRPNFVYVEGRQLMLDGEPFVVRGINYYPQEYPWHDFLPNYQRSVVEEDLRTIKNLGLNTVRTFILYEHPGGPDVPDYVMDNMQHFLDYADRIGLKVMFGLFDFRADYNLLLWSNGDRHMETILTEFADHPGLLAWDLKNEPDFDYDSAGKELVDGWLRHIAVLAREYDPNHLLTIGWALPESAFAHADLLDFVSYHHYKAFDELPTFYGDLRFQVPDKPLVLSEIGLPTWNSPFFPNGHTEAEQAYVYAETQKALKRTDSAGHIFWTLYDFNAVPSSVAGAMPWQKGPQAWMGIRRKDGSFKPAAALVPPDAKLNVEPEPAWRRFTKPFWITVFISMFIGGMIVFAFVMWLRDYVVKTFRR